MHQYLANVCTFSFWTISNVVMVNAYRSRLVEDTPISLHKFLKEILRVGFYAHPRILSIEL